MCVFLSLIIFTTLCWFCDDFRPFNSEETRLQTPAVLTCNDRKKEVAVAQNIAGKQIDKTFLFDKV